MEKGKRFRFWIKKSDLKLVKQLELVVKRYFGSDTELILTFGFYGWDIVEGKRSVWIKRKENGKEL